MKQFLLQLRNGLIILGTAFGMATATNFANHKGYWDGTIKRVQTVDFNILSHTLPTKLSLALIQNNKIEIQRTLNSNYGLFGIVVTNCTKTAWECSDQQILYVTESNKSWREKLKLETLRYHPFDLLRDPPPVLTEMGYEDSRDQSWELTNKRNPGKVIGRVYYIRGIPPSFQEEYGTWLSHLPNSVFSNSGAQKYYALTLGLFNVGGLAAWGLLEWLSYSKRAKERQFQRSMRDMQLQLDQTEEELEAQINQNSALIDQRIQLIQQLKRYEESQNEHALRLNQRIAELEVQLASQETATQPESLEQVKADLEAEIRLQEQAIASLQSEITFREQSFSLDKQEIAALSQKLSEAISSLQQSQQARSDLQRQNADNERERQVLLQRLEQVQQEAEAARQKADQAHQQWQEGQNFLGELKQQNEVLEAQLQEFRNPTANEFEKEIVAFLLRTKKVKSRQWLIHTNKDVKRSGVRQFVDGLVFARSCVVIIEAKNHAGRIEAEGEATLTPWFKIKDGQRIEIKSCHGCNPYEQVNQYTDSVRGRLRSATRRKLVKVYSLIVFPNDADLTAIPTRIDRYSRVLHFSELVTVIRELENSAINQLEPHKPPLSAQELENIFFRRPKPRNPEQDTEHRDAA